ncbi:SLBB domain-containing protein [candidate division KSB1 bacterium]|nr:SLBB domain-containing protein [candidate division KSB1 bacterium]
MKKQKIIKNTLKLILLFSFIFASLCHSQNYKINAEDILHITFLDKPELDRETQVGLDGNLSLPVVGSIKAAGLTTRELAQKIISEFSIYTVRLTQVSVEILKYESNKVYVTGHVANPGKYTFEKIPNLWSVISEAGGPTETANLSNVLIIRGSREGNATIPVNLKEIIKNGELSRLPELEPGDNIHLSAVLGENRSQGLESPQQQRPEIYFFGEINDPGIHTFDQGVDILQAIITAGGPTSEAKLKDVRVIRRTKGNRSKVIRVNLKRYVNGARNGFFKLETRDTVYIPRKKSIREGLFGTIIFSIIVPVISAALIYELVIGNN